MDKNLTRIWKGKGLAKVLKVVRYKVESVKLPEEFNNFKIIQLSDLHGRLFPHKYDLILTILDKLQPDIIVLTGDMIDNRLKRSVSNAKILCERLSQKYSVYFVHGNHEQAMESDRLRDFLSKLETLGIQILENKRSIIKRGCAEIELNGLVTPVKFYNDPLHEYQKGTVLHVQDIRNLLGSRDDSRYNILLTHNPIFFKAYCEWGANLTLAGHIHGGIIDIPRVGGLLSPDVTFFPQYYAGRYKKNGKQMIVSRGLCNRFWLSVANPSEIVFVVLASRGVGKKADNINKVR